MDELPCLSHLYKVTKILPIHGNIIGHFVLAPYIVEQKK